LLSEAYEDVIMDCVKRHKIKLALLAGIAIIVGYNFLKPERLFIVSQDRSFKIEIPRDIVKAHDCKAYKEWLHKHATPMLISSDRCPWSKPPKGPIGEFEINGVKLYVPRNYLLFDKRIPDGDIDNLTLLMKYPEMTAAGDEPGRNDYHVMVSIDSTRTCYMNLGSEICNNIQQQQYEHLTCIGQNKELGIQSGYKKLYDLPKERLTAYNICPYEKQVGMLWAAIISTDTQKKKEVLFKAINTVLEAHLTELDFTSQIRLLNNAIKTKYPGNDGVQELLKTLDTGQHINKDDYPLIFSDNINIIGHEYLLRGDPLKPDYWLQCASAKASNNCSTCCNTTFNYNNNLYVKYSFSRERILKTHDDLRAKIISKIDEFNALPN
jgi:hypothetical protein